MIAEALKRMRPKVSAREAARRVPISEGRWRQIVQGYQTVSGTHVPVRGPAETVARMAAVVGLSPRQLGEVGREDAAEELRLLQRPAPEPSEELDDLDARIERIRRDPVLRKRLLDLLVAARLPDGEDEVSPDRRSKAG